MIISTVIVTLMYATIFLSDSPQMFATHGINSQGGTIFFNNNLSLVGLFFK